ncbi:MAG: lamin tail domain-containing protein [Myxococcales bacterium]|nr:lamin tail domain-containing protein [Myxococcales bacterium]
MSIGLTWGALAALVACRRPTPSDPPLDLVINEVVSANATGWVDPESGECPEHDDWIELFNAGAAEVSLAGFSLADDANEPWPLPARTIAAGEHLVLVADGDVAAGGLHLPFSVSREGDVLTLIGPEGRDVVEVPPLDPDLAWGRYGDGADLFRPMEPTPGAPNEAPPPDPCLQPLAGFDDHTVPCLGTTAGFEAMASGRPGGLSVVKLDITGFPDTGELHVRFLDNRFYALHDEWYLFRMLNGATVEGEDLFTPYPGDFATIAEIYAWARAVPPESLFPSNFMRWTSTGRLTSDRYYQLALAPPRRILAGTLVHAPATGTLPERWAWELEHSDVPSFEDVDAAFRTLIPALAPEIGADLRWLIRSPEQEALAQRMEAEGLTWHDRLLRYDELSEPGTVEVYRPGTVAGRVRVVRAGEDGLEDAQPSDVLVLDEIPDYLPPCAALITTVPQTPLAHVALLAESRGIPNLHVAGLSDDPQWDSWKRTKVPVVIRATEPDGFEFRQLDDAEWATWLTLQRPVVPELGSLDVDSVPWTVDLASVPFEQMPDRRLELGGKSAGFVALLSTPGVVTPDHPLGITVRGYHHHLDALRPTIDAVLADPAFARPGDEQLRFLVLEGRAAYDERYASAIDATAADLFLADHPAGDPLGDVARADGLKGLVESTPMPVAVADQLLPAVSAAFADMAPEQGLRFRSSSNVEDAEGFVGAGLYDSNTGYVEGYGKRTFDEAIRATWASYWGAEAFEERHGVGIDHLAGDMGVTVHPNFQDEAELANGVIHAALLPDGGAEITVNSQVGAISVTNPPVDACEIVLPDVALIAVDVDGTRELHRLQRSTESPDTDVLTDAELHELADMVLPVLDGWLVVEDGRLAPEQARSVMTLDLEFRRVADGWPVFADGHTLGDRLVLKQCRSLEPSAAGLPDDVQELPFPRDLLARAAIVDRAICDTPAGEVVIDELTTDPLVPPDMGYAALPFVGGLTVDGVALTWLDLASVDRPAGEPVELHATLTADATARTGLSSVDVGAGDTCATQTLWASPESWLQTLLP